MERPPVLLYRLSRWCYLKKLPFLPDFFLLLNRLIFSCEIHYLADIGKNFKVTHLGLGTIIAKCRIGDNVRVLPGAIVGGGSSVVSETLDCTHLGNNVVIGSGAKVFGRILVGEGSAIAANAVVLKDIPPFCLAGGVPAKVLRENYDIKKEFFYLF